MKTLVRNNIENRLYTERIIQFGEGNFLRAFADWIIYNMNLKTHFDGGIVVVQPIPHGMVDVLNGQEGLYHLILKGIENGEKIYETQLIDVITRGVNPYVEFEAYLALAENPDMRFIISNTTEAGIAFDPNDEFEDQPASSYPGKLVQLLYHRFNHFKGAKDKGFIIFPCELIFENGTVLKECINQYIEHWHLGDPFYNWVQNACGIYNTLVDRIVPGFPFTNADEIKRTIGFNDGLIVEGEIFHLWVIEAPESVAGEFPANEAGLNVLFVSNEKPYHERKVTLLNGPHTLMSPVGYLSGLDTVRECIEDEVLGEYVRTVMFKELLPTLDLPEEELMEFSYSVLDRFSNPYIKHLLTSIMLNSFSKFKTRVLPVLKRYFEQNAFFPKGILLGLAGLIKYYEGGKRGRVDILLQDDPRIIDLLQSLWKTKSYSKIARGVLGAEFIWEENLNDFSGLTEEIAVLLEEIENKGMKNVVKMMLEDE